MELIEIVPTTTVEEAPRAYRSAKVGRFQRYHFGGCKNGSHTPTESSSNFIATG